MDFLKRELAPVPAEAWIEIDAQAARSLKALLSARKVVDLTGPMGTNFPGVPEGRLEYPAKQPKDGLVYGIHKVHHLVETRIPFELDIAEMDNVVRGAKDVDLSSLEAAAKKIALFEDSVALAIKSASTNLIRFCQVLMRKVPQARRRSVFYAANSICLSLRALPITETEEKLMAAAAMIGESKIPKNG
jgi:uncharacterized linocin/CFP29 family protein